jgi:hypothetical protein
MIFDVTSNEQQISMSRLIYHSFGQGPVAFRDRKAAGVR